MKPVTAVPRTGFLTASAASDSPRGNPSRRDEKMWQRGNADAGPRGRCLIFQITGPQYDPAGASDLLQPLLPRLIIHACIISEEGELWRAGEAEIEVADFTREQSRLSWA